ncbi:MAG: porin family protein [Asticcacaulis sp.]
MKLVILAAASVLALSGAAANAQDTSNTQGVGHAYGSIGVTGTDNHKTDTNLNGVNVRLGTRLSPHFGVEGETAFGTNHDTTADGQYKLTSKWGAYGVGYVPVSSSFDLIGRVGVSDTDLKTPAAAGKLEQGTAFDYGVGAQYHINNDYALRADVTRSEFNNNKGQSTTTSLNLVKKF